MTEVLTAKFTPVPGKSIRDRLNSLRLPLAHSVRAWRAVGRSEFTKESWRPPGGGERPWKRVLPFPAFRRDARAPDELFNPAKGVLRRTDKLRNAWLGGSGSITRIGRTKATFGISSSYGAIHRGGTGRITQSIANRPERVRVTRKMRLFLGLKKGLWLSPSTTEIVIPRRPHFTKNPEIVRRLRLIFQAHAKGEKAPIEVLK